MQLLSLRRSGPLKVCTIPRVCFVGKLQGRPTAATGPLSLVSLVGCMFRADGRTGYGYFLPSDYEEVGHEGFGRFNKGWDLVLHPPLQTRVTFQ